MDSCSASWPIILTTFLLPLLLCIACCRARGAAARTRPTTPVAEAPGPSAKAADAASCLPNGLIAQMRSTARKCAVFYGSQTGTAEEYAVRLSKEFEQIGLASQVVDPEAHDMSELLDFPTDWLAIFVVSTYGEGEPTDNVRQFYEWLGSEASPAPMLSRLHYSLFGLGNKTYEHYNAVARRIDERLGQLGACRVGELGLGDDNQCLEEDFIAWKESCWPLMCSFLGVDPNACALPMPRGYKFEELSVDEPPLRGAVFTGEPSVLRQKSQSKARKIYDALVPYEARVHSYRQLSFGCENEVFEVVIDLGDSHIHYAVGDHLAVYPRNDAQLVEAYAARLGISASKMDVVFEMTALDALECYLDLTTPPRSHILKAMAEYSSDEPTRIFLSSLARAAGREEYQSYIHASRRTVLEVLNEFPSVQMPASHLFELLPRLQCRYYSISSSPRVSATKAHLTLTRVGYTTLTGRRARGVASNWLCQLGARASEPDAPRLPVFVRKSIFKLPRSLLKPMIMVGPGTGLAPFIGFLSERAFHRQRGVEMGQAILFFGCRRSDQDFLYREELQQFVALGALSRLETAFSRDQSEKIYVQHRMLACAQYLYDLIDSLGAYIYVCGDAKGMAIDVCHAFEDIIEQCSPVALTREKASAYVKRLKDLGRYLEDVWS